jgi:excalibur calcium-binding domain-containing protein
MNIIRKYVFPLACGIIICILQTTTSLATTEFRLFPNDNEQIIFCDHLEIENNNIACSDNNLLVTYNIEQIQKLEVITDEKSFFIQNFTQETIEKINTLNLKKINHKKEHFSFNSLSDFTKSFKNKYSHLIASNTVSTILQGTGLIVLLIGSFWYLITTFRTGILWGLSCMFLPFVSFVFLFVHWKVAAKPFLVSILGVGIALSGTLFVPPYNSPSHIAKYQPTSLLKKEKSDERYKCKGKIYCSEMTSCAEAKFYLRNCKGTKIDGNHDGVPCEKQWCK